MAIAGSLGVGSLWLLSIDAEAETSREVSDSGGFEVVTSVDADARALGWELVDASHLFLPTDFNFSRGALEDDVGGGGQDLFAPFTATFEGAFSSDSHGEEFRESVWTEFSQPFAIWLDSNPSQETSIGGSSVWASLIDAEGHAFETVEVVLEQLPDGELLRGISYSFFVQYGTILGVPLRAGSTGSDEADGLLDDWIQAYLRSKALEREGFVRLDVSF